MFSFLETSKKKKGIFKTRNIFLIKTQSFPKIKHNAHAWSREKNKYVALVYNLSHCRLGVEGTCIFDTNISDQFKLHG